MVGFVMNVHFEVSENRQLELVSVEGGHRKRMELWKRQKLQERRVCLGVRD